MSIIDNYFGEFKYSSYGEIEEGSVQTQDLFRVGDVLISKFIDFNQNHTINESLWEIIDINHYAYGLRATNMCTYFGTHHFPGSVMYVNKSEAERNFIFQLPEDMKPKGFKYNRMWNDLNAEE